MIITNMTKIIVKQFDGTLEPLEKDDVGFSTTKFKIFKGKELILLKWKTKLFGRKQEKTALMKTILCLKSENNFLSNRQIYSITPISLTASYKTWFFFISL